MASRRTLMTRLHQCASSLQSAHHAPLAAGRPAGGRSWFARAMTRYLITFPSGAMDHIPAADFPAVGEAARAVCKEAIEAGVYVFAGGLLDQPASVVGTDGTVSEGTTPQAVGGIAVVDVPTHDEALRWAAKLAAACRCAQEVREVAPDAELDALL